MYIFDVPQEMKKVHVTREWKNSIFPCCQNRHYHPTFSGYVLYFSWLEKNISQPAFQNECFTTIIKETKRVSYANLKSLRWLVSLGEAEFEMTEIFGTHFNETLRNWLFGSLHECVNRVGIWCVYDL